MTDKSAETLQQVAGDTPRYKLAEEKNLSANTDSSITNKTAVFSR